MTTYKDLLRSECKNIHSTIPSLIEKLRLRYDGTRNVEERVVIGKDIEYWNSKMAELQVRLDMGKVK